MFMILYFFAHPLRVLNGPGSFKPQAQFQPSSVLSLHPALRECRVCFRCDKAFVFLLCTCITPYR